MTKKKKIILKMYKDDVMIFEKENTEEKIIDATFHILEKEGVQKATTKRIAAEAGVNEVTIFRKFGNKKNLIETIVKNLIINNNL